MKFPFFASFIVLIIWLKYEIGKSNKKKDFFLRDFWNLENQANSVRKKPLNNLHYINIPYDLIPTDILTDNDTVKASSAQIEALRDKKILNLTGITNTELKLNYGTANFTVLSEYDQNYTELTTSIYSLASTLYENGYEKEAVRLLEFGVMTNTDISGYYRILYQYYLKQNNPAKIQWLTETAESLNSIMKEPILRLLSEDDHID